MTRVCFVGLYCYPLFNPKVKSPFGGAEVKVSILSKELAKRDNFEVSMLVFDHGQPDLEVIDGVRLVKWNELYPPIPIKYDNSISDSSGKNRYFFLIKSSIKAYIQRIINRLSISPRLRIVYYVSKSLYGGILTASHYLRMALSFLNKYGRIGTHIIGKRNVQIYGQIDVDLFIYPGNNYVGAELLYYCQKNEKKYILWGSSDNDFTPRKPEQKDSYGTYGFLADYVIRNADAHVTQNPRQSQLLKDNYNFSAIEINNPVDLSNMVAAEEKSIDVLWVGKSDQVKRPELAVEAAKDLPHLQFTLIMNFSNGGIHENCLNKAEEMHNLEIKEYVPYERIEEYYARSRVLINSSVFEGFPNAFLQAAKYGVPIISLEVDPSGILSKNICGSYCSGDYRKLISEIESLLSDTNRYNKISNSCQEYVNNNHNTGLTTLKLEALIKQIFTD